MYLINTKFLQKFGVKTLPFKKNIHQNRNTHEIRTFRRCYSAYHRE
jgi:hypothetical protein